MTHREQFSVLDQFRLNGDVAMVTGGGAGIGRVASLALAEAGAHVCVTDINAETADKVADDIRRTGGEADAWLLNVGDEDAVVRVVGEIVARHGKIDILINNAGIAQRDATETMPTEVWDRIVRINQTGVFLCAREAGAHMLARGKGSIINIASIMGLVGGGLYPNLPYHATKGALVNLTRALAAEWAGRGVRVNAIAPTFVTTDLTLTLRQDPEKVQLIEERTPMGRFAEPEDMAGGIVYLASPASRMVTGHTLAIDGGWTAI